MKNEQHTESSIGNGEIERDFENPMLFHQFSVNRNILNQTISLPHIQKNNLQEENKQTPNTSPKRTMANRPHLSQNAGKNHSELILKSTSMTSLPQDFIRNYLHIKSLDIRDNKIDKLPEEITQLPSLKILRLDNNKITTFPRNFYRLDQLQILTLSQNGLRVIDNSISIIGSLTALALNDNQISEWPSWLSVSLPKLRLLHLHNNPIRGVPFAFTQMNSLNELSLDWFLYVQPPIGRILQGAQGMLLLNKTKELCKKYEEKAKKRGDSIKQHCNFFDFLSFFMDAKRKSLLSIKNDKKRNPFHMAAINGHKTVINEFIESDMDLNEQDNEGSTAFVLAIRAKNLEIANILLSSPKIDITLAGKKIGSPLHLSIFKELYDLAKLIASNEKLDPNITDSNGNTALHFIFAKYGDNPKENEKIALILVNKANCKLNLLNKNLLTPLHCATKNNQSDAIKFALNYNKNANSSKIFDFNLPGGKNKSTPLMFMAECCEVNTLQICLEREKFDVLAVDDVGKTARDHVRNTLADKILYKYERQAIQNQLGNLYNNNVTSIGGVTDRQDISQLERFEVEHNILNRICLESLKIDETIESIDFTELDQPLAVAAYFTNPPKMFEEIRNFKFKEEINLNKNKNKKEEYVGPMLEENEPQIPQVYPIRSQNYFSGNPAVMIKKLTIQTNMSDIDVRCNFEDNIQDSPHRNYQFSPSFQVQSRSFNLNKTQKFRKPIGMSVKEEVRDITLNQYFSLYETIIQGDIMISKQYRLLFYIFSKYISESEDVLIHLCQHLPNYNPLKLDAAYLLGLSKSRKALKILTEIKMQQNIKALQKEVMNSIRNVKIGKTYLPINHQCKQNIDKLAETFKSNKIFAQTCHFTSFKLKNAFPNLSKNSHYFK